MCFSATASFSLAITTGAIGIVALRQVTQRRELMLAITPVLFALQQIIEGVLWLQLTGEGDSDHIAALAFSFRIFAEVLWPAYTALALLMIEPDPRRRRLLGAIAVIGGLLSIYLLTSLISEVPAVAIRGHSISYASEVDFLSWRMIPYLLCTCGALLLSSHRILQLLGGMVAVGFAISAYVYFSNFISVWCFFTAAASTLIYFHFKRTRMALHPHLHHS